MTAKTRISKLEKRLAVDTSPDNLEWLAGDGDYIGGMFVPRGLIAVIEFIYGQSNMASLQASPPLL